MKAERQKAILDYVLLQGSVTVPELAERFRVSLMTVRRDLAALEQSGPIMRLAGKAVAVRDAQKEPPYRVRMYHNPTEKARIAERAVDLVKDGDFIFLGIGSTCLQIAKRFREKEITVVTNWIPNLVELAKSPKCSIVNTGGHVSKDELSSIGVLVYETLAAFNFGKAFIGVGGIGRDGITDFRMESAEIMRRVIQRAEEVIVVADHSKFGKVAPVHIASLQEVDKIILSDIAKVDGDLLGHIRNHGVSLLAAGS